MKLKTERLGVIAVESEYGVRIGRFVQELTNVPYAFYPEPDQGFDEKMLYEVLAWLKNTNAK